MRHNADWQGPVCRCCSLRDRASLVVTQLCPPQWSFLFLNMEVKVGLADTRLWVWNVNLAIATSGIWMLLRRLLFPRLSVVRWGNERASHIFQSLCCWVTWTHQGKVTDKAWDREVLGSGCLLGQLASRIRGYWNSRVNTLPGMRPPKASKCLQHPLASEYNQFPFLSDWDCHSAGIVLMVHYGQCVSYCSFSFMWPCT